MQCHCEEWKKRLDKEEANGAKKAAGPTNPLQVLPSWVDSRAKAAAPLKIKGAELFHEPKSSHRSEGRSRSAREEKKTAMREPEKPAALSVLPVDKAAGQVHEAPEDPFDSDFDEETQEEQQSAEAPSSSRTPR